MEKSINLYLLENNWILISDQKKAKKTFKFKSFIQAFSWMTEVAFSSETQDHHPNWTNVYNVVDVVLSTHDRDSLTEKDSLLAGVMDKAYEKYI